MVNANELQIMYLFGDVKKAVDYFKEISDVLHDVSFVDDIALSQVTDMEKEICQHCKNEEMFTGCRHLAKRIVGECEGAISELTWNELLAKKS